MFSNGLTLIVGHVTKFPNENRYSYLKNSQGKYKGGKPSPYIIGSQDISPKTWGGEMMIGPVV